MPQYRTGLVLAALVAAAACDIPTAAPIYDTLWETPGKSTSISVNTILPSGVQVTPDGAAFQVTVTPSSTTLQRTLAQDCPACVPLHGQMAPKPAFTGSGTADITLPSSVASATLVRDTVWVSITNGFSFDPIRPSATARGYLLIHVKNGNVTIGRDSLDGATTSLAAGSTRTRAIPLSGTITGANGLRVVTTLFSPAGDPVMIDIGASITATLTVGTFYVSAARVTVANQTVSSTPTSLDLTGIDDAIRRRANGGSLRLTIDNPFDVTGELAVSVLGAEIPIQKTLSLAGGRTARAIEFTKQELAAMLGRNVSIAIGGAVTGASVDVAPGQGVSVTSRLQVALGIEAQ